MFVARGRRRLKVCTSATTEGEEHHRKKNGNQRGRMHEESRLHRERFYSNFRVSKGDRAAIRKGSRRAGRNPSHCRSSSGAEESRRERLRGAAGSRERRRRRG